jgi:hypothetical protein
MFHNPTQEKVASHYKKSFLLEKRQLQELVEQKNIMLARVKTSFED